LSADSSYLAFPVNHLAGHPNSGHSDVAISRQMHHVCQSKLYGKFMQITEIKFFSEAESDGKLVGIWLAFKTKLKDIKE